MRKLAGKTILICGGASGIGAETARRLAGEGARIAIGDLKLEGAEAVAAELRQRGAEAIAMHYDQADEASVAELVRGSAAHYGRLDGVFANAADLQTILEDANVLENDLGIWQRTLNVNLIGVAAIVKASLPHLLDAGGGTIVCTSSSACTVGEAERPAYAASKAGLNALCRHVASRWGKQGIRCNAIAPGFVITEQISANMPQEMLDSMLRASRSARHGQPADIAGVVAMLMSDDGEWINGQTWHVNGGVWYAN